MARDEILTGLDIGSSQVCCVIGKRKEEDNSVEILGGARLPCKGVKGGVVINLHETQYSVEQVIEKVEEQVQESAPLRPAIGHPALHRHLARTLTRFHRQGLALPPRAALDRLPGWLQPVYVTLSTLERAWSPKAPCVRFWALSPI